MKQPLRIKAYGVSNETTFGVCEWARAADKLGMPAPASVSSAVALLGRCLWASKHQNHGDHAGKFKTSPVCSNKEACCFGATRKQHASNSRGTSLSLGPTVFRGFRGCLLDRYLAVWQCKSQHCPGIQNALSMVVRLFEYELVEASVLHGFFS